MGGVVEGQPSAAGWIKNLGWKLADFVFSMDLTTPAVDLNLKLMRWRVLPNLGPEMVPAIQSAF